MCNCTAHMHTQLCMQPQHTATQSSAPRSTLQMTDLHARANQRHTHSPLRTPQARWNHAEIASPSAAGRRAARRTCACCAPEFSIRLEVFWSDVPTSSGSWGLRLLSHVRELFNQPLNQPRSCWVFSMTPIALLSHAHLIMQARLPLKSQPELASSPGLAGLSQQTDSPITHPPTHSLAGPCNTLADAYICLTRFVHARDNLTTCTPPTFTAAAATPRQACSASPRRTRRTTSLNTRRSGTTS
jgi:hypothetical protein